MSIRRRLLLTFTLVTLVGSLSLFLVAGRQISNATLEFYRHDLETEAVTLTGGLSEVIGEYGDDEGEGSQTLQALLQRAQTDDHKQYTVLDRSFRVLASTDDYRLFEQFPDSNALESALRGHTSHWEKSGTVYIASPVRYEAETRAVLILSAPMAPAYEDARQAWLELGVAVLPVLLLVLGASWWFGRTLSRPIQQLHASVLQIADGDLDERVDATTRDEIGELGRAVNFMAERLNLLINAQRSFVSNAAHELRTPLMNLKLRIDALQEDLSLEQRQAYLRESAQEVEHMANLVTKLLALARLDEGRYAAPGEAYDLVALLHDLTRQWRIQASNAQLRFETSIPNTLPDCRVAASDLRMILDNVLGNAVKYTPQGGQVRFCASQEGQTVRFEVIDSGAGFAAGDVDRLFERFFRTDDARQLPGTGLGLSIVQAMVAHYDGTITAASGGPGLGAHFTIILPAL